MDGLFREEAVRAHQPQWLGSTRLAMPVSQRIWGLVAALITISLLGWLWFGHYTRREHVTGRLVPDAGLLRLTARAVGTIAKLDVTEGAIVTAGQPLISLAVDRSSATMGETGAIVAAKLRRQQSNLRTTVKAVRTQTRSKTAALRRHVAFLKAQIHQMDGQLALQSRRSATARALVQQVKPLHQRGVVSSVEFDQYQAEALANQAQLKALRRQRLDLEQQQNALQAQLVQLPLDTANQVRKLRGQLAQLDASLARNALQRKSVLRAPVAGVISSVLVSPGQAVKPGQALVTVLPKGSTLLAQLLVPSAAIGFVHKGTPVDLHYQAFPYQKFGVQHGKVIQVSHNALVASEVTTLLGQAAPPVPVYRVKVKLARQSIEAYGKPHRLLPGMVVDADLLLDRRRLVEWIFEPLYGMAKRNEGQS